jgi:hypothetical protein
MAKLTDLPEALTLPTNAKVYVVDEDDATDDPSGSSKQMDASLLGGGIPAGTVVKEEIDRKTATAGAYSFTGLDLSAYDRIFIKGYVDSDRAGQTIDGVGLYQNGDTNNANYFIQSIEGNNNTALGPETDNSAAVAVCGGADSTLDASGIVDITIENPSAATGTKLCISNTGVIRDTTNVIIGRRLLYHKTSTAAITQLDIASTNGANLSGTIILYGEKTV